MDGRPLLDIVSTALNLQYQYVGIAQDPNDPTLNHGFIFTKQVFPYISKADNIGLIFGLVIS